MTVCVAVATLRVPRLLDNRDAIEVGSAEDPMTTQQAYKALAWFLTVCTALLGLGIMAVKWEGRVDFDVTGFLWLLQNALPLSVVALFLFCASIALSYWFRAYRDG